jgi:hypothetical protein
MPQLDPFKASTRSTGDEALLPRISARTIREALADAEQKLAWCTRVVGALSGYKSDETTGNDVVEFQQRLYRIIADLEVLYRRIKREEKRLIGAKARYIPVWFAKRMAQLSADSEKLRDGLMLARRGRWFRLVLLRARSAADRGALEVAAATPAAARPWGRR